MIGVIFPFNSIDPRALEKSLDRIDDADIIPIVVINDSTFDAAKLAHLLESRKTDFIYLPYQIGKAETIRKGIDSLLMNKEIQYIAQIDGRNKQPLELFANLKSKIQNKNTGKKMVE